MTEKSPLPSFESPPVIEVVLGAQFKPIAKMTSAHLGLVWEQFRQQYPQIEERPPLNHEVERIGVQKVPEFPQFAFQMGPAPPRIWMVTESGEELIQVQQDRFISNWRKHATPDLEYPRYENLKPGFADNLAAFIELVESEGLGSVEFDQCEVTYVNHIIPCKVWQEHRDLSRVFKGWSADYQLSDLESLGIRARHQLLDSEGTFVGRLHVEVDSVYAKSNSGVDLSPIFLVKLIARGRPMTNGIDGVLKFLDLGHEAIVSGFTDMTTNEMHEVWGRIQ